MIGQAKTFKTNTLLHLLVKVSISCSEHMHPSARLSSRPVVVQHESHNSSQAEVANNSISLTELKVVFSLYNAVFWTIIISFDC